MFMLIVYSMCAAILLSVIAKRAYDTYHGVDPTWGITERGVHPGRKTTP